MHSEEGASGKTRDNFPKLFLEAGLAGR